MADVRCCVLICDGESAEPTSALDEETMKQVENGMLELLPNGSNVSTLTSPTLDSDGTLLLTLALLIQPDPTLKAFIWITHEASQADRVGTRTLDVSQQ